MRLINQYLNYLILILVVGYIAFYLYSKENNSIKKTENIALESKPSVDQVVNKYMQETSTKNNVLMATTRSAIQNELLKAKSLKRPKVESEMDVPAERQIWKEQSIDSQARSPNEEINVKIQSQELRKAEEEAYKKEYARQYIENARQNGYHITLDENLNVIKATPIRRPSDEDSVESFPAD